MRKNISKSALVVHKQNQKDASSKDKLFSCSEEEEHVLIIAKKNPEKMKVSLLKIEENE